MNQLESMIAGYVVTLCTGDIGDLRSGCLPQRLAPLLSCWDFRARRATSATEHPRDSKCDLISLNILQRLQASLHGTMENSGERIAGVLRLYARHEVIKPLAAPLSVISSGASPLQ